MGCLLSSTLKEVSMNGHSSNIGYNIFISFTKFFLTFTSLVRLQQRAQILFFMLYNFIFVIF